MASEPLLQIEALSVAYGPIAALRKVSLSLHTGEIVAIIGANGAGKTTLINTISGLVRPQSGQILFQKQAIQSWPAWKVARHGIVQIPEGRKVFPKLSVCENLELGGYLHTDPAVIRNGVERMYEKFPILRKRCQQPAGTLSGGEQQMLAIARGLMAQPRLLMFDEPSMGLSPMMVENVFQIIREIHGQGIPVLLVEQNARKSLQIADRAYVLETGEIVLSGTGDHLLHNDQVQKAYLGVA